MSAAIAMAPSPAPHDHSSYVDIAPAATSSTSPPAHRQPTAATPIHAVQRRVSGSPKDHDASPTT